MTDNAVEVAAMALRENARRALTSNRWPVFHHEAAAVAVAAARPIIEAELRRDIELEVRNKIAVDILAHIKAKTPGAYIDLKVAYLDGLDDAAVIALGDGA